MNRNLQLAAALALTLVAGVAAASNPDAAWISHVQDPSPRPADGCPASFISRDGLVLAGRQCVSGCIQSLSTAGTDYARDGFYAAARSEERQCPAMELDRLERVIDVTARMQGATMGLDGEAFGSAQRAEQARIESGCVGGDDALRCEVVKLDRGGIYSLYRYRRYRDVRLVLAPETRAAAPCGTGLVDFRCHPPGMSLLRVYEDGKPARVEEWLRSGRGGAQAGEWHLPRAIRINRSDRMRWGNPDAGGISI